MRVKRKTNDPSRQTEVIVVDSNTIGPVPGSQDEMLRLPP